MVGCDIERYCAADTHIANVPNPPVPSLFRRPHWNRMWHSNYGVEWFRCPEGNHMRHIGNSDRHRDCYSNSTTHMSQKLGLENLASD